MSPLSDSSLSHPPPPTHKPDRSTTDRISDLLSRLDLTREILDARCRTEDAFGMLTLRTLEKDLKDLGASLKVIVGAMDLEDDKKERGESEKLKEERKKGEEKELETIRPSRRTNSKVHNQDEAGDDSIIIVSDKHDLEDEPPKESKPPSHLRSTSTTHESHLDPQELLSHTEHFNRKNPPKYPRASSTWNPDSPATRRSRHQTPLPPTSPSSPTSTIDPRPPSSTHSRPTSRTSNVSSKATEETRGGGGTIKSSISRFLSRTPQEQIPSRQESIVEPSAPLFEYNDEVDESEIRDEIRKEEDKQQRFKELEDHDHKRTLLSSSTPRSSTSEFKHYPTSFGCTRLVQDHHHRRSSVPVDRTVDEEKNIGFISRSQTSSTSKSRSQESRRVLELASAPPSFSSRLDSEEEEDRDREYRKERRRERRKSRAREERLQEKVVVSAGKKDIVKIPLDQEEIVSRIVHHSSNSTLVSLALVSKIYLTAVQHKLYTSITLSSIPQVEHLERTFESKESLSQLVEHLEINPLESSSSEEGQPSRSIPLLRELIDHCKNLRSLREDFTRSDYDVTSLSLDQSDYILTRLIPLPNSIETFVSKRCWWDFGPVKDLLEIQRGSLKSVTFGGAVGDQEWEAEEFKNQILASSSKDNKLLSKLERLEIRQVMHEDTLSSLLLLVRNPDFKTLRIGFTSIGTTRNDTPFESIPQALKYVASSLTNLCLIAPMHLSEEEGEQETMGLLDQVLPLLPLLEHLEFQENPSVTTTSIKTKEKNKKKIGIASKRTLSKSTIVSRSLKTLTIRQLIGISTEGVYRWLDDEEGIPVLEEIDIEWGREEEGGEGSYDEKWAERVERLCEEFGIKCRVVVGDGVLSIG